MKAAWLLTLLLVAPLASADYTHVMGDAARTAIVDAGPELPNTLWREPVGGTRAAIQTPLIYDGYVYVATLRTESVVNRAGETVPNQDPRADVYRLNLHTGEGGEEPWIEGVPAVSFYGEVYVASMSIGAGQLVIANGGGAEAYDLNGEGREPVWTWTQRDSRIAGPDPITMCFPPMATDEQVVFSCLLFPTTGSDPEPRSREAGNVATTTYEAIVASFDPRTCKGPCEPDYTWSRDAEGVTPRHETGLNRPNLPDEFPGAPSPVMSFSYGATLQDGVLALAFVDYQLFHDAANYWLVGPSINHSLALDQGEISVWVLDASDLSYLWDDRSAMWLAASDGRTDEDYAVVQGNLGYAHIPRIHNNLLYHTVDRQLIGAGIGTTWLGDAYEIGKLSDTIGFASNSITIRDDDLWVGSMDKLYRIKSDLTNEVAMASTSASALGAPSEKWLPLSPFLLADDLIYATSIANTESRSAVFRGGDHVTVHAMDANTLDTRWRLRVETEPTNLVLTPPVEWAVSDGIMILHDSSGHVMALGGEGEGLQASGPSTYPDPGEEVTVHIKTPAERYQFDWGDGSELTWTTDPIGTHSYTDDGIYNVVAIAETDGYWTAKSWTVHVGGTPSNEFLGWVEENPDAAWGIFGLIIVLVGAAFTSYKIARRRGLMARELAAIDAAAEAAGSSSTRLPAAMEERRARAHGLLLDRRIDEAQYQILTRHIDEASRGNRMNQLRSLFDFLPFSMVRALEEMLDDGEISAVEHRGIKAMLADNTVLTKAQKSKVGALVQEWFAQDAQKAS